MPNHRKPPNEKMYAICGSVQKPTKDRIVEEAKARGITVAQAVGAILHGWVGENGGGVYRGVEGQESLELEIGEDETE